MKIAIVGCGSGALFLAANLKADITIFERNKKVGSKLLASGNGKCNLLNINATEDCYNNAFFVKKLINDYSPSYVLNKFHEMNLLTKIDAEGRVYPICESSEAVLNILMDNIKAKIITEYKVESITKISNKYRINDYNELFDYVILDTGSNANLKKEYQTIPYDYLKSLDIKLTSLSPSLVGFKSKENLKKISGFRSKANVELYVDSKLIHSEYGEVIFKDDGISGIVVMNMSSYYNDTNKQDAYLVLDLLPGIESNMVRDIKGAIHPTLYRYYIENKLTFNDLKNFRISIKGTYDNVFAQVISGGVDINQINDDLSLKKDNNIFLMGEMLDIDGLCGGYNLLFTFMCALKISDVLKDRK